MLLFFWGRGREQEGMGKQKGYIREVSSGCTLRGTYREYWVMLLQKDKKVAVK